MGAGILHLTLHKKWFALIASENKKYEYRQIKPYWTKRLMEGGEFKKFGEIFFVNGYGHDRPSMRVEFLGINYDVFENEKVYAIKLGKIFRINNYKTVQSSL